MYDWKIKTAVGIGLTFAWLLAWPLGFAATLITLAIK